MKPAELALKRLAAISLKDRLALIERGDVPVDLFDAIEGELKSKKPHLDLRLYCTIKNYCAHKLDKESFKRLFPES
jgi:hypothetical protein